MLEVQSFLVLVIVRITCTDISNCSCLADYSDTMQVLSSPTRKEVDAAHAKREWMEIGIPSIRNLWDISLARTLLWIILALSSIPLHLL